MFILNLNSLSRDAQYGLIMKVAPLNLYYGWFVFNFVMNSLFKTIALIGKYKNPEIMAPLLRLGEFLESLNLIVVLDSLTASNIPEKKWLHVVIRNNQNKLDVFINGTLAKSHLLSSVPKQNYGDVYVAMNGGFMGNTSSLRYYNSALNIFSIKQLTLSGPNLNPVSNKGSAKKQIKPGYFSMRWYLSGNEDSYNP